MNPTLRNGGVEEAEASDGFDLRGVIPIWYSYE
jgi:hypothetical protein